MNISCITLSTGTLFTNLLCVTPSAGIQRSLVHEKEDFIETFKQIIFLSKGRKKE